MLLAVLILFCDYEIVRLNTVVLSKVTCLSLQGRPDYERLLFEKDYFSMPINCSYLSVHIIDVTEALEDTLVSGEISLSFLMELKSS